MQTHVLYRIDLNRPNRPNLGLRSKGLKLFEQSLGLRSKGLFQKIYFLGLGLKGLFDWKNKRPPLKPVFEIQRGEKLGCTN